MNLAKNPPIQRNAGDGIGGTGTDVRAGFPEEATRYPFVLQDHDSGEGRPADSVKCPVQIAKRVIPASMRFMPFAGAVEICLRKIAVEDLTAWPSASDRREDGIQVIKVNRHAAILTRRLAARQGDGPGPTSAASSSLESDLPINRVGDEGGCPHAWPANRVSWSTWARFASMLLRTPSTPSNLGVAVAEGPAQYATTFPDCPIRSMKLDGSEWVMNR